MQRDQFIKLCINDTQANATFGTCDVPPISPPPPATETPSDNQQSQNNNHANNAYIRRTTKLMQTVVVILATITLLAWLQNVISFEQFLIIEDMRACML